MHKICLLLYIAVLSTRFSYYKSETPDHTVTCAFEFVRLASLDTCVNTIKSEPSKLANSARQFILNGYTGFTFPAAHYPVKVVSAEE